MCGQPVGRAQFGFEKEGEAFESSRIFQFAYHFRFNQTAGKSSQVDLSKQDRLAQKFPVRGCQWFEEDRWRMFS